MYAHKSSFRHNSVEISLLKLNYVVLTVITYFDVVSIRYMRPGICTSSTATIQSYQIDINSGVNIDDIGDDIFLVDIFLNYIPSIIDCHVY